MLVFLQEHILLLLAVLLFLGSIIGQIKICGVSLGETAVLFVALGLAAWAGTQGVVLEIPEVIGNLGMILFTYTIGITSGPSFFASLKRGWKAIFGTVLCLTIAGAVALFIGKWMGLSSPLIGGIFSGALTSTPALAAAGQASGDPHSAAVGYSISYIFGVLGVLIAVVIILPRDTKKVKKTRPRLNQSTIHVDIANPPRIAELHDKFPGLAISRVTRENEPVEVAAPDRQLRTHDLISVIGTPETIAAAVEYLGHESKIDIIGDRTYLDSNRITLSVNKFSGKRIRELGLWEQFGAQVSRVRRGDLDMIVDDDFRVQSGDRLRVVAPRENITKIRSYLGDSERGFSNINPAGLALGLALGILLGCIPIPLPSGTFALGSAAGTLIVGLIFGRIARIGSFTVSMPSTSAQTLSSFGMLTFLAYTGTKAGTQFVTAITSGLGWKLFLLGVIITTTAAIAIMLQGKIGRINPVYLAGQLAGAQTQSAVLAFANTRTEYDNRVSMGYALVYPAAMVAKILLAQVLVLI